MKLGNLKRCTIGGLIAAGCVLTLGSGATLAESACKGMEQAACEKAADCTWVGPYEKKDGKQVSGYCRGKGGAAADDKKDDKGAAKPGAAKTPEMPAAKPKAPEAPAAAKTAKPVEMPAVPKTPEVPAAVKTPKPIEMPSMPKTQPPPAAPAVPAAVKDKPKAP